MTAKPIGHVVDALGVQATIEETDLVSEALVLFKIVQADGTVTLRLAYSPGGDWITRVGMLNSAISVETPVSKS